MKNIFTISTCLLILSLLCHCGGSDDEPTTPIVDASLQGTWNTTVNDVAINLRLNDNGTCSIIFPALSSTVPGNYTQSGNEISFVDDDCSMDCDLYCASNIFGSYTFSISGDELTFQVVSDDCDGRKNALTSSTWTKQ